MQSSSVARSLVVCSVLALACTGLAIHPSAASARPSAPAVERDAHGQEHTTYVGIRAQRGYVGADGRDIDDYFFHLPDEAVRDATFGAVLEPDDPIYQRIVSVGEGLGYCIDAHREAPTRRTPYHLGRMRDVHAAEIARDSRRAGRAAVYAVWEWRRHIESAAR